MQTPEPGLRTHDRERATPGFTLFSPIRDDRVFLIDMDGRPVHEWKLQGLGGTDRCQLTDDGNLFVTQATREGPPLMAGKGGLLREYDWDGDIVWEMCHSVLGHRHDCHIIDNGNVLLFANGFHGRSEDMFSHVFEIDPRTREIVWRFDGKPPQSFYSANISGVQRLWSAIRSYARGRGVASSRSPRTAT